MIFKLFPAHLELCSGAGGLVSVFVFLKEAGNLLALLKLFSNYESSIMSLFFEFFFSKLTSEFYV
jgi:hypothetical protein